jgi:glycosyltransferase involved in cell wall biosynthesis
MNILIVLDNYYIPQYTGGVESSTHELAAALKRRGHRVSVLCKLAPEGFIGLKTRALRRLSGKAYAGDSTLGYPVYRAWDVPGCVAAAAVDLKADVALVQNWSPVRVTQELGKAGVPAVVYLHNVMTHLLDGDLRSLRQTRFVANSSFTATRYRELFGLDCVVLPPLFAPDRYVGPRNPSNVTFVNPHPKKGVHIAFGVAELCPDIPFELFQSWTLGEEHYSYIRDQLARLPNVAFHPPAKDMRKVYGKAKVLLAPSTCEEAWGRVASEAQFSGIPVVASDIGGLPESVGPGGILIDPDAPIEVWADAIRRLWTDEAFYAGLSSAALDYSARQALRPDVQVATLSEVMTSAMAQPAAA